jgi:nucleotide-binding universal stress UspA family protein
VFDRVVCALDASPLWLEAVRQACLLGSGVGQIELVGVIQTVADEYSAYGAPAVVSEGEHSLARRLADAQVVCSRASIELLQGPKLARLLVLLEESDATLVAVGAASRHRGIGIVRGELATGMLHRAPSSVLVARATSTAAAFPQSVVVGYDGSVGADAALSVARDLADRFDASVRLIAAGDASATEFDALAELTLDRDQRSPVEALLDASANADLLIVGSRGLHGLHALGSVSERVGHQAPCSVLVVREQPTT